MTDQRKEVWAWEDPESGWKSKNGKIMPFEEMTEAQLNKFYRLSQHKELVYANKSSVFHDKAREIERVAEAKGIPLKGLETEFHSNTKMLKS